LGKIKLKFPGRGKKKKKNTSKRRKKTKKLFGFDRFKKGRQKCVTLYLFGQGVKTWCQLGD